MSRDAGRGKGNNKGSKNKRKLFLPLGLRDKKRERNEESLIKSRDVEKERPRQYSQ